MNRLFLLLSGVYLLQYQTPYPNPFSPISCFSLFPPVGADGGAEQGTVGQNQGP